ncbi:MAG: efflux RND transporter permease subunit [Xanthomonadales bacterium]|nr:efflux RND transporter permease subunit [Gammaproteobacteria bacterium]MBT8053857.1 efflux RND transporter permease subunit [Gammaproteobacteria bacterium]NND58340.1 efflux RND transporter permease subunit [Xanthomonadales bacterium]NNK51832.1 efflux RND transporter permease subunit [Xanthomonadales bacterium]
MNQGPYESLIIWFARNSVAANLLMFILLVGGFFTVLTIKKEIQPQIDTNFISISVPFLGATPLDVEEGVVVKIEEAIQDIEGIEEIVSTARRGAGVVSVEVMADYEVTEVMDQIKNRVDGISTFPDNTEKPNISRTQFQQQVVIVSVYGDVDERTLKEYVKQVRNEVVTLPGVTRAEILGSRPYEISIEVSEFTLQSYGMTLPEVAQAVRRGSLDLSAGAIRSEAGDILVRTKGQAYVGRDFENIVIRTNPDGTRLLLKDIAHIRDEFVETDRYSEYNGKPAISIRVLSVGNQSELDISKTVHEFVERRTASLPDDVQIAAWADVSYYLKGRLDMMVKNLVMGAALVFLILALFLRLKLAFWVMVGLPIAFMGAFFVMPAVDVTVNMLSLFGFILVLGIVVDDAIVIGESSYTNMRAKGHSVDNIVEGVLKVAVPATFGVLTTMVAFLPILLVSGISGQFFAAIGWVVILCLTFSLVESKLILPAHLAHMKVKHYEKDTHNVFIRFQRFFSEGLHDVIDNHYAPFLAKALKRRYLTLSIFISMLILSIGLLAGGILRFVFFPDFTADFLQVELEMNEGTPASQTHDALRQIQNGLWEVDRQVSEEQGVESGAVVSSVMAFGRSDTSGQVITELVKENDDVIEGPEVLRRWREAVGDIPGVKTLGFEGATGPGGGPSVSLQLMGSNIEQVGRAAKDMENRIRQYEGVYDVRNSYESGTPEIKLNIKPEAEALGLTLADLARQVRAGFYGEEVQRVQRGQDEVKVMVRFPRDERDSVGYLDNMRIRTPDGGRVPFHAVAEVEMSESPTTIRRFDRERAVQLSAEVDKANYEPGKITADVLQKELPQVLAQYPGVRHRLSGATQAQQEVQTDLIKGALFALFLIYALMAIPLRSYSQPLIIMSVIPFGTIGALIGHLVIGIEVSMMSFFGIIALAGVVVNDSLILVDFVNRERRLGVPLMQAVTDAASKRFRAILLTSLTTFFGLVPIVLETSLQAQIVIPMAASLAFGILFATVITLFLIPALYLILEDFGKLRARIWNFIMPGKLADT